jgi:hypothetical protein
MKKPNASLRLILSLTALLLVAPAVVQAQFAFTTNNGAITITGYTGRGGDVTIPDWTNGHPVTSIGTSLGPQVFLNCNSLTSIRIGTNATSIWSPVASFCHGLTAITVNTNNPAYSSVAGVFFNKSQTTLIECPQGKAGSYTIPNSVTSIGNAAFEDCTFLTTVTIPNSVTNIEYAAFEECTSLTSVTIPNSVINIGWGAFQECALTNVTIPNSVTSIGDLAFDSCRGLTAITVNTNNPAYSSVAGVLFNKSQTTLIEYPEGKAGSYTIPNSVTSIGDWAFDECAGLTNVTIPNSLTSIGNGAFNECAGLTSVTIPNGVTSIGYEAFEDCFSLATVTIPNSVTTIGDAAFVDCTSLTSVTIPNSLTSIGGWFDYCTSLSSVTIPNSVTSIGDAAFNGCSSLTNVTIGTNVTSLEDLAFYECSSLTGVYFQGNAPSLGSVVFAGDTNATVYYLPETTGWGATFGGCPTALWGPPSIQTSPQTQTAEAGSVVGLWVQASSPLPLFCLWYFNATNLLGCSTNCGLELTNFQFSQSGAYTVVITNAAGAVTSSPAMLNVIAAVERRPVPGVNLTGQTGSLLNVDYASLLSPAPNWATLGSVSLTSTSQYCFDLTLPLPPQRFYRAWQTGTPGVIPSLDLHLVPAITLTGNLGDAWRVDYINRFGPTDAWATLDTVTLTNTSQLYFDVSAPGQPPRLYRLVQVP